ncbi:MAG TPA: hypothetical protein VIH93_04290 [Thermoanaerobaculia bacterium]
MRRSHFALLWVGLAVIGFALGAGAQPARALCPDGSFQCTCNGVVSCQTSILGCWNSCESASRPDLVAGRSPATASFLASLALTAAERQGSNGRALVGAGCTAEFCDSCALLLKVCQRIRNICFCAS